MMKRLLVALLVAVTACGPGTYRAYVSLEGVRVADDGVGLTLVGVHGACDRVFPVEVRQTPQEVRISVPLEVDNGPCHDLGVLLDVAVTLDSPLGQRELVDDRTGDPLDRLDS